MGVAYKFRIVSLVPQCQWEDAHQRTVSLAPVCPPTRFQWMDSACQTRDGLTCLDANVEYVAVHSMESVIAPIDQSNCERRGVKTVCHDETFEQAKRLRTIVGPSSRHDAFMRSPKRLWRLEFDQVECGNVVCRIELVRHPKRIPDEEAEQAAG